MKISTFETLERNAIKYERTAYHVMKAVIIVFLSQEKLRKNIPNNQTIGNPLALRQGTN